MQDTVIHGIRHVLMVAWKSPSFQEYIQKNEYTLPFYKSSDQLFKYPLFVTTKSDLQKSIRTYQIAGLTEQKCKARLQQLLGIPPKSGNDLFFEFWIPEHDLFRPAIDSSLQSNRIIYRISDEYLNQWSQFSANSYSGAHLFKQYPFTGMGYTWDCNPANFSHIGVSEFVLKENRTVFIRRVIPTMKYIQELK